MPLTRWRIPLFDEQRILFITVTLHHQTWHERSIRRDGPFSRRKRGQPAAVAYPYFHSQHVISAYGHSEHQVVLGAILRVPDRPRLSKAPHSDDFRRMLL